MTWDNLELDIALELASFEGKAHVASFKDVSPFDQVRLGAPEIMPASGFLFLKSGSSWSLIKRTRPDDLLENLVSITASRPAGPWTTGELVRGLGWGDSRGASVSVGRAMAELGWKVQHKATGYKKKTATGRSRPTGLMGVYTK
jgi:hypothetical protein